MLFYSLVLGVFVTGALSSMPDPFELFENYNLKTTEWIKGGSGSKEALEAAMGSVYHLVPWLVAQPEFPPGLDPLVLSIYYVQSPTINLSVIFVMMLQAFAANILAFYQTTDHVGIALPLLESALQLHIPVNNEDTTLENACRSNFLPVRRTCQDLYVLLVAHHYHVGRHDKSRQYLEDYNRMVDSLARKDSLPAHSDNRVVEDMSVDKRTCSPSHFPYRFDSPERVHRQLPGLRAEPWWDEDGRELGYTFLQAVQSRFADIRREVLLTLPKHSYESSADLSPADSAELTSVWGLNQDLRLSTNEAWDPLSAWEAVPLHANGQWINDSCAIFPVTCGILKAQEHELLPLLDRHKYMSLLGSEREQQDYTEVPTLGIKLYKVWPGSGIKNHTGSPGRIVSSIAVVAPTDPVSTLTVAGETRPWVEGEFISFDDSFFHSVANPHPSMYRVVLAIVSLHPDLLNPICRAV